MKKFIIAVSAVVVMSGCALPPAYNGSLAVPTHSFTCSSASDCSELWLNAQDYAEDASGMKIRLLTDTRIETYSSFNYGYRAIVNKVGPNRIDFRCEGAANARLHDLCESDLYGKLKTKLNYLQTVTDLNADLAAKYHPKAK